MLEKLLACWRRPGMSSPNPVHSAQWELGEPDSSTLISGFMSREFFQQDSFCYIFQVSCLIRLKAFPVRKSSYVIQRLPHQAASPTQTASWLPVAGRPFLHFKQSSCYHPSRVTASSSLCFWSHGFYLFLCLIHPKERQCLLFQVPLGTSQTLRNHSVDYGMEHRALVFWNKLTPECWFWNSVLFIAANDCDFQSSLCLQAAEQIMT